MEARPLYQIETVNDDRFHPQIREIFLEYMQWVNEQVDREYGISFDIQAILEQDMLDLGKFMPPGGCLLLGFTKQRPVGIACLKALRGDCGEIKRMYVRPDARRIGLGRALLEALLTKASQLGYSRVRLDSARFMVDAHRLYRSLGFQEIDAYEGSEIPADFQRNWVFMHKDLILNK